jgi:hypothetical protein
VRNLNRQSKRRVLLLVLVALLVAVAALASSLRSSAQARVSSAKTPGVSMIATDGTPVTLTAKANARLSAVGITHAYLLGTEAGRSYYKFVKQDGSLCYGVSAVTNPDPPGMVICLNSETVPPVLDFSVYQSDGGASGLSVWRLEGLVNSSNVARIDLLGAGGQVAASVPVANGVYYDQFASPVPVSAIEHVDASGNVVAKTAVPQAPTTSP